MHALWSNTKRKTMVSLNKIIQAKRTVDGFISKTPFALAPRLSKISGADIYLKRKFTDNRGLQS